MRIKLVYRRCDTFFQSYTSLYKHIKADCKDIRNFANSTSSSTSFFIPIPIINSTTQLSIFDFHFIFRKWNQTTTTFTFGLNLVSIDQNLNNFIYFNTDCKIIFTNELQLLIKLLAKKINIYLFLLRLRGLVLLSINQINLHL